MPNNSGDPASSILFGTREQVGVGRGLAEFRGVQIAADSMDLVAVLAAIEEAGGAALDETVFAEVATCRDLHARM